MRMKSQLSLIISFQVETSLTIVLFLLLCSYYYPTMISAEQRGKYSRDFLANTLSATFLVFLCQCFTISIMSAFVQKSSELILSKRHHSEIQKKQLLV